MASKMVYHGVHQKLAVSLSFPQFPSSYWMVSRYHLGEPFGAGSSLPVVAQGFTQLTLVLQQDPEETGGHCWPWDLQVVVGQAADQPKQGDKFTNNFYRETCAG